MRSKILSCFPAIFCLLVGAAQPAFAQGTAFTYQGRLTDGTNAANGSYELGFYLRDALINGNPVGTTNTLSPVSVSNGMFTVTLDFGANVFTGPDRWLEIGLRTNGGAVFTTLSPRQELTPTPYAITAENLVPGAGLSGIFSNALNFSNSGNKFAGDGSGLTNVSSSTLNGLSASNFWQLTGNSGTSAANNFVGTKDTQPLELRVNGVRGWRLEPTVDTPNIIGNPVVNFAGPGVQGVTIGGGGSIATYGGLLPNTVASFHGTIGGGLGNTIQSNAVDSTIAGGNQNVIQSGALRSAIGGGFFNLIQSNANESTIAGGDRNLIQSNAPYSTIGGGVLNVIQTNANESTIAGGNQNLVQSNSSLAAIGGGFHNVIQSSAQFSMIGGGSQNVIVGFLSLPQIFATIGGGDQNMTGTNCTWSTIGGGRLNLIEGYENSTTIAGGEKNVIHTNSSYAIISGGIVNSIGPNAAEAAIGGGAGNNNQAIYGTISGGQNNNIQTGASAATVSGGSLNVIGPGATDAVIAGGVGNTNQAGASVIGGGQLNLIIPAGFNSVIGGGYSNYIADTTSTIGGGAANSALSYDNTIGGGRQNTVSGPDSTVGGGEDNSVTGDHAVIAGGGANVATGRNATIGGGILNSNSGFSATISGGADNVTTNGFATIGGGQANTALGLASVIGGGQSNSIFATVLDSNHNTVSAGSDSVISGGYSNLISGNFGSIGGGMLNLAPGFAATVPGGLGNQAAGAFSFAAGQNAQALNDHSFVWGDGTQAAFSLGQNSFGVLATGGINFAPALGNVNILAPGSLAFGFTTRQMLNLYDIVYGIGVQNFTLYQRTAVNGGFSWFRGGVHSDSQNTPGTGGTEVMRLDSTGSLSVSGSVTAHVLLLSSDRNLKAGFETVDTRAILEKVAAMPITRWHFTNDVETPHLGPMAQDFQAAFQLSQDDKHISVVDEGGVALAAIQGLNQELQEKSKAKDAEIQDLKVRLERLEQLINNNNGGIK